MSYACKNHYPGELDGNHYMLKVMIEKASVDKNYEYRYKVGYCSFLPSQKILWKTT